MNGESEGNYAEEGEESDSGEIVGGEEFLSGGMSASIRNGFAAEVKTVFESIKTRSFSLRFRRRRQFGVFVTHPLSFSLFQLQLVEMKFTLNDRVLFFLLFFQRRSVGVIIRSRIE